MARVDDGGPAFARAQGTGYEAQRGMTLRDWFAGRAIDVASDVTGSGASLEEYFQGLASMAYRIADAMLAERSK